MDSGLETFARHYRDRESAARAHKANGGKVVGYFSNNVPEELIIAAGLFPVHLTGDPALETDIGDRYMEEFFDGNIRSIFDRMLRGHFNFADLIVVPRTSEGFLQLYYFLLEVRKWEPQRAFPEIYLFDLLQTPNWTVGRYDRGRMEALRAKLEQVGGHAIEESRLRAAIAAVNENRRLLGDVNRLRRAAAPRLSGQEMLQVIGSSMFMDKAAHSDRLAALLAESERLTPRAGRRIMVKGSPHEHDAFYALIESCRGVVVADDHVWGERIFEHRVAEDIDPMEALTEHYHLHSPSPRSYPQARQDETFLALLDEAGVEGVIFYHDEWDDVLGWDYPQQKKLLDARDMPSLFLKRQSYRTPDVAAQRAAVAGFIEALT